MPESIEKLEDIQKKITELDDNDLYGLRQLDTEFHGIIADNHYNDAAATIWRRFRTALMVHASRLRISPIRKLTIIEEHEALLQVFRDNDPVRVREVITKHVSGSFSQLSQQMRAHGLYNG